MKCKWRRKSEEWQRGQVITPSKFGRVQDVSAMKVCVDIQRQTLSQKKRAGDLCCRKKEGSGRVP